MTEFNMGLVDIFEFVLISAISWSNTEVRTQKKLGFWIGFGWETQKQKNPKIYDLDFF
jgi:hypothetical protein